MTRTYNRGTVEERFWKRVEKDASGCWLWEGSRDKKGYGRLGITGRTMTAAQRAYEDQFGREALARQTELARAFWPCCGEPNDGPHHAGCSKHVVDEAPAVHADQAALSL